MARRPSALCFMRSCHQIRQSRPETEEDSKGQNLALTVLYVPHLLDRARGVVWDSTPSRVDPRRSAHASATPSTLRVSIAMFGCKAKRAGARPVSYPRPLLDMQSLSHTRRSSEFGMYKTVDSDPGFQVKALCNRSLTHAQADAFLPSRVSVCKKKISIELMTPDCKLKASSKGSRGRDPKDLTIGQRSRACCFG